MFENKNLPALGSCHSQLWSREVLMINTACTPKHSVHGLLHATDAWTFFLDMLEWREMTEQIHWSTKQPSQVASFSKNLKWWGAWDTAWRQKAKDSTPSITWRKEAWKEEALDDLPWRDESGPLLIGRTLELFQRWRGNFWETGCSAYGLSWTHRYHLEQNWTELTLAASLWRWNEAMVTATVQAAQAEVTVLRDLSSLW